MSKPSLEVLAIIAYKQPVTRADVELIRGVNSDGIVNTLTEKELLKVVGRKDIPGKPYLYGTTKQFLEYFGLKSLDKLPKLEEFEALQEKMEEAADEEAKENPDLPEANSEATEETAGDEVKDSNEEGNEEGNEEEIKEEQTTEVGNESK